MESVGSRLRWARERAGFETAADAARALGLPPVTVRQNENDNAGVSSARMAVYAKRYRVSLEWLLTGRGRPAGEALDVSGVVGDGGEVFAVTDASWQSGYDPIPLPPSAGPNIAEALAVEADALSPVYDFGDRLITRQPQPPERLIGRWVLAELRDGRRFVRRLEHGSRPGLYSLHATTGAALRDVEIVIASPVGWRLHK